VKPDAAIGKQISEILDDPDRQDEDFTAADGRTYRVRKRPAPGVKAIVEYRETDGPFHPMTELFDPTPQRPASYPEDLPFVPDMPAMIGGMIETIPPSRMVGWSELGDARSFALRVIEQSRADGWVAEGEPKAFGPVDPVLEMRRASATRHVSAVANDVFVLQTDSG
jgi:hypothetical protein